MIDLIGLLGAARHHKASGVAVRYQVAVKFIGQTPFLVQVSHSRSFSSIMNALYRQFPNTENLNAYCAGGFHPVHLNDTFKNGRYTVVHKLGSGQYSTVWLVKDSSNGKYESLKILAADASKWSGKSSAADEAKVLSRLRDSVQGDDEGRDYVMKFLDSFDHEGPNGVHLCIVTEVLGPTLGSDVEELYPNEIFPAEIATRFVYQLGLGVRFLHKRGVVHGGEYN